MYRDDGGFDGGSYKFVEIVEKPRNIDPPPSPVLFVFSSNCFDVFFDHMISPRDSKLTRDYIYIYKFNISFYSIFFFVRLYFIFVADHILKNRSNLLRYLRDARFNLFERSRQIPSDLFYSRSS